MRKKVKLLRQNILDILNPNMSKCTKCKKWDKSYNMLGETDSFVCMDCRSEEIIKLEMKQLFKQVLRL